MWACRWHFDSRALGYLQLLLYVMFLIVPILPDYVEFPVIRSSDNISFVKLLFIIIILFFIPVIRKFRAAK